VGGLFAVGVVAVAPLSVGLISVGLLSLGCLSAGFWAAGLGAVGWLSHGAAAAGWEGAKGVFAVAHGFAFSEALEAKPSPATAAFFKEHEFYQVSRIASQTNRTAMYHFWLVPVFLMGRHLWRTRPAGKK